MWWKKGTKRGIKPEKTWEKLSLGEIYCGWCVFSVSSFKNDNIF
jgi:hypothetical protein